MPLVEKENTSVALVPAKDADGRDVLVLVAKRTYRLDAATGGCTFDGLDAQPPVHGDDVWAEGGGFFDDVLAEDGEMAPWKPKVDVVVRATAFAPGGKAVPRFEVAVQVGGWQKRLAVIGDRRCVWQPPKKETRKETVFRPPLFTEPEPIAQCPVTWRHAYGGSSPVAPLLPPDLRAQFQADLEARRAAAAKAGTQPVSGVPDDRIPCPFNPVGKGFALGHSQEAIDGLALPNLEDPARPLTPEMVARDLARILEPDVVPAGLGWVAKGAWMRAQFAGFSPDEATAAKARTDEQLASLDPDDPANGPAIEALSAFEPKPFDPAFHNGAPLDQQLADLAGDEVVTLTHLDPTGRTTVHLPGRAPLLTLDRGRGPEPVVPRLDTLVIDRLAERVTLIWRGHLPYGGPDELAAYPRLVGDVRDVSLVELRQQAARLRAAGAGGTEAIRLDSTNEA